MFAYYDKSGQVAMLAKGKLEAPNLTELEVDETDQAIIDQKEKGGQLFVENGIIIRKPLLIEPIDVKKEMMDALEEAKDFNDFKKRLSDKLK
jgi:hypothetical protein